MCFCVAVKKEAKNARSSRTNKFRKTKQNARLKILLISSRAFSSYIKFGGFGRINFFIFSLPFGRFLMCQYSKTRRYLISTTVFACSRRLIGGCIFVLSNWNWLTSVIQPLFLCIVLFPFEVVPKFLFCPFASCIDAKRLCIVRCSKNNYIILTAGNINCVYCSCGTASCYIIKEIQSIIILTHKSDMH